MPSRSDAGLLVIASRAAMTLAAALMLFACSTSAPVLKPAAAPQAQQGETDETAFTITEDVRVSAETRADYESAMQLLAQKQYEQGIAVLLEVTQSAPDVTAPHVDLGIAYGRAGDLDRAEASLKRALELNPRHPVAYNEIGMVYRRKGQFAAARASYEKAIELLPGFHFARLNLAILCDLYLADRTCALNNYVAYQQSVPDDKNAAMWIADLRARASR